ncbi:MAG TPA: hypothetical protein VNA69_01980 [Thermoanaerobaculia bacterium]|nr:hypothetical protein [Thermoanaerobaculia bacterium]
MRSIVLSLLVLVITVAACSRESADMPPATAASAEIATAPAVQRARDRADGGLDIAGTDSEALCKRVVPADLRALGVSDRWSADRRLVHRKLYGDSRVACAWEGFDPERPASRATTFFRIEIECGKNAEQLCADKAAAARLQPGTAPYPESVEGALCHTLSKNASNNWVIVDNGCFVILYEAKPDIMGISAEERERRVRETKLAVARAVVANLE